MPVVSDLFSHKPLADMLHFLLCMRFIRQVQAQAFRINVLSQMLVAKAFDPSDTGLLCTACSRNPHIVYHKIIPFSIDFSMHFH